MAVVSSFWAPLPNPEIVASSSALAAASPQVPQGDAAAVRDDSPAIAGVNRSGGRHNRPGGDASYDLALHHTLSRVVLLIRDNYVDPERIKPYEMFLAALDFIEKAVPEIIVGESAAPAEVSVSVGDQTRLFGLGEFSRVWDIAITLREILRFIRDNVSESQDPREIEYAAINGMLSTLDPHSVLLRPESFDEVKLSTKGEFGGLGIVISIRDATLTIISPIDGTPASRARLRARDKIVRIGEESTINMTLEEAVSRLRGRPGTDVEIWILRKGWSEARPFRLTRSIIKIESVTSELLAGGVGYVRIKSFQGNTYGDLRTHLETMKLRNAGELTGLVLDLRNNPGGLLDQAILVADSFIDRGALVITVGEGNRRRDVKAAHIRGTERDYPIAVLVNGGSASASEIVAGALKNHGRAVVIGEQTFGKGSVQVLYDFKDRSALKLTIAQYLTPGDISIQSVGIQPDLETVAAVIEPDSVQLFADHHSLREKDLTAHLEQYGSENGDNAKELPATRIVHLLSTDDEENAAETPDVQAAPQAGSDQDEANAPKDDAANDPDRFVSDFEIELARDLLSHSSGTQRRDVLEGAGTLLAERTRGQEQRIVSRLRELGVDWSSAPEGGVVPVAESETPISPANAPADMGNATETGALVSLQLLPRANAGEDTATTTAAGNVPPVANTKTAPKSGAVATAASAGRKHSSFVAGDEVMVLAEVRNTGSTPLWRVSGTTSSENHVFRNLEFPFGMLMPGESRRWQVAVTIPRSAPAQAAEVAIEIKDATGRVKGVGSREVVEVRPAPAPRFFYAAAVDDMAGGNGDGVLQVGERVNLLLTVKNGGDGAAQRAMAMIKNRTGPEVFLDVGRTVVGTLGPNEQGVGVLGFTVKGDTSAAKFELSIWDAELGAVVSDELLLPIEKPVKWRGDPRIITSRADKPVTVFSGTSTSSPIIGTIHPQKILRSDVRSTNGKWRRVRWWPNGNAKGKAAAKNRADAKETKEPNGTLDVSGIAVPAFGFVAVTDFKVAPKKRRGRKKAVLRPISRTDGQASPKLRLDYDKMLITGERLNLSGSVSDERGLLDVFVYVNDKKVFYRSLRGLLREDGPNGLFRLPLELELPVEPGSSTVSVIARESDKLVTKRVFSVYRPEINVATTAP